MASTVSRTWASVGRAPAFVASWRWTSAYVVVGAPPGRSRYVTAEHDPPSRLPALEHAVAVGEAARRGGHGGDLAALRVERAHRRDGVADFLAVGADVLDRGRAHQTRDAAQAFEPGPAPLDCGAHHAVPGLAGRGGQLHRAVDLLGSHAAQRDLHDHRVHALVGDDQVGAAAQHAELGPALPRPPQRRLDRRFVGRMHEPARRPAHAERGQRAERDALLDLDRGGHGISRVARHALPA